MVRSFFILTMLIFFSCGPKKELTLSSSLSQELDRSIDTSNYQSEIMAWREKRVTNLTGPSGWLNLAGLFWLSNGINTFGSSENNAIQFPKGRIPERAGYFTLDNSSVLIVGRPGVEFSYQDQAIREMIMYHPDVYHPDSIQNPALRYDSLEWFIIKHENRFAVRLRDLKNPLLKDFKGIDYYPIDASWRLKARFIEATETKTLAIADILGMTTQRVSPGSLVFNKDGKEYELDVLEGSSDDMFVIFGDDTNAKETYGAGRYMYVKKPDSNGVTIIDFNKAYNPPCAFTAFATCPLPPRQNIMNMSVYAGEKNYGEHH